jgi:CheY-like chemotaxis protein/HPt (histidine-containing phosphotransfer) domain-containing protein
LRFTVRDTGVGISEQGQASLFQMFNQVDGQARGRSGGTGLGLAISKRLVDLMGGRIGVESAISKGSTFWFTLPLRPGTASGAATMPAGAGEVPGGASTASRSAAVSGLRILVADDNPVNQQVAAGMLRRGGHSVDIVGDGAAALEAVAKGAYDLVLMDVEMPELDGFEATRRIRLLDGPNAAVPIIALTAHAMRGDEARCIEAGMSDYMPKPISRQRLDEAVRAWGRHTASARRAENCQIIDRNTLDELLETMGHGAELLFETFLADSASRVAAIRLAVSKSDTALLELELHSLSGAASTMELPALVAACEQMRKALGQEMKPLPEHLPEHLVDQIESAVRDAREALLSCALAA